MKYITEDYLNYLNLSSLNEKELFNHVNDLLTEGGFSVDSIKKSFTTNFDIIKQILNKYNIDKEYIKSEALKVGKFIINQQEKRVDPKTVSSNIVDKIGKKIIKRTTDQLQTENPGLVLTSQIITSVCITAFIFFIQTFLHAVLLHTFSAPVAMLMLACIVAPIIEESAKRYALLNNYPFLYTGIFAGIEALIYIQGGAPVFSRIIAFIFHLVTVNIQKKFHDQSISLKNEKFSKFGYYTAIVYHSLWNFFAVLRSL